MREVLRVLPDGSVHCVVTSPPYWGLRDYGIPRVLWGGDPFCSHEWEARPLRRRRSPLGVKDPESIQAGHPGAAVELPATKTCPRRQGWLGPLGLEPDPDLFVDHLASVFDEVHRVLRADGTLWLNLGDTYHTDSPVRGSSREAFSRKWDPSQTRSRGGSRRPASRFGEVEPKDLTGIPWRVAFERLMGLRRWEVLRIRLADLGETQLSVRGKGPEGGRPRRLLWHSRLRAILPERLAHRAPLISGAHGPDSGHLFAHLGSEGRVRSGSKNYIDERMVRPAFRVAGLSLPGTLNHALRRTCGRTLWENGVPIGKIAELLGHSDTKTTQRYLALRQDDSDATIRVLERRFPAEVA